MNQWFLIVGLAISALGVASPAEAQIRVQLGGPGGVTVLPKSALTKQSARSYFNGYNGGYAGKYRRGTPIPVGRGHSVSNAIRLKALQQAELLARHQSRAELDRQRAYDRNRNQALRTYEERRRLEDLARREQQRRQRGYHGRPHPGDLHRGHSHRGHGSGIGYRDPRDIQRELAYRAALERERRLALQRGQRSGARQYAFYPATGRIEWPPLLQEPRYRDLSRDLSRLFRRYARYGALSTQELLDAEHLIHDLQIAVNATADLYPRRAVRDTQRFLNDLGREIGCSL